MKNGDDPIVEELRRIRWKICKKAGGTPADYFRYYYEMDQKIFGENSTADAATPVGTKAVSSKPRRKSAKPAARTSSRKPRQRRRAVTA